MRAVNILPKAAVGRRRLLVLAVALLVTALKIWLAATTVGSNDAFHFQDFAGFVHKYGPIGIYGKWEEYAAIADQPPYNHPPLIGWLLAAINAGVGIGWNFFLLIRLPAILADLVSVWLVFELVRAARRSVLQATVAGLAVALSPVLFVISGFHGNTDPAFVLFAMLSFYLLVKGRTALCAGFAGLCFGVSISIKLVPIVVLPLLLVLAWRAGRRRAAGFVLGAAVVFGLLWVPVIIKQWAPFSTNVLGYAGWGSPRWGIPGFLLEAGASQGVLDAVTGPGRFVVLLVSAGLPAFIAWRRPEHATVAFGLTLSLFLLLSTATAMQYLAWAAAPSVLAAVWFGTLYNATAGAFCVQVYSTWNLRPAIWDWERGYAKDLTSRQTLAAAGVWFVLLAAVVMGLWYTWRSRPPAEAASGPPGDDEDVRPEARLASA
jgi:hypothetical protein